MGSASFFCDAGEASFVPDAEVELGLVELGRGRGEAWRAAPLRVMEESTMEIFISGTAEDLGEEWEGRWSDKHRVVVERDLMLEAKVLGRRTLNRRHTIAEKYSSRPQHFSISDAKYVYIFSIPVL